MTTHPSRKIPYIQGLRALCVLTVLIYHVDPAWMLSGYLGVDAFFAISGYVITRLIMRATSENRFTLRSFYLARINRLLPSLFIVVVVTVVAFSFLYGLSDRVAVYASSIFASLSLANVYFFMDAGYFAESSIHKPLLHTWSLGVEEQFYLLWPLCLLFLIKKHWARPYVLFTISVILLFITVYIVRRNFDIVFYLMPFRAYQLMFGAGFALLAFERHKSGSWPGSLYLFALPIAVILLSVFAYDAGTHQFYAQALTALFVAGGCFCAERHFYRNQTAGLSKLPPFRLLESRIAQYLGDRSYLIYLVHWPLIAAFHHLLKEAYTESLSAKIAAIVGTIVIAEMFHYLLRIRLILATGLIATLLPAALLYGIVNKSSEDNITFSKVILPDNRFEIDEAIFNDKSRKRRMAGCRFLLSKDRVPNSDDMKRCVDPDKRLILVLGDSFGSDFYKILNERGIESATLISVFMAGCPPYFGESEEDLAIHEKVPTCAKYGAHLWRAVHEQLMSSMNFDSIVVAANWSAVPVNINILRNSLTALDSLGQRIILVGPRPIYSDNVVRLHENNQIADANQQLDDFLISQATDESYRSILYELGSELKNIEYLDIYKSLCSPSCPAYHQDELMYIDHTHLSKAGVRYVAEGDLLNGVFN